jgi:pimeloyl-ACP methyl ester carboxylesterase
MTTSPRRARFRRSLFRRYRMLTVGIASLSAGGLIAALALVPPAATAQSALRVAPISWRPCPSDPAVQCAAYRVPLDYAHPANGEITLAVYRHAATDQAHRIGTLFVNPGGPGDSAFKLAANLMTTFYPALAARFDVIGMDPRGVGASTPIQCFATNADREQALAPVLAVPLTPAETAATARADHAFTSACAAHAGPLLAHMSTLDAARDLDTLRQAVGDRQLSYFGMSYGTLLGATYANLYPGRVRAMALDGMVDPAARTGDSLNYEMQRATGTESVLDTFLNDCRQAGTRCAFSGGDPAAKFAAIRARIWSAPVALPDGTTMTASRLWNWLSEAVPNPANFPALADYLQLIYTAITAPASGPASTPRPAASPSPAATYSYNSADAFSAVNCLDEDLPRTPQLWPAIAGRFEHAAPTFGRGQAYSALTCATWPVTAAERYSGPWNRPTAHPLLIVANLHDADTPYQMAVRASSELAHARLLTINGIGHTSMGESACATSDVTAYLLYGQLPANGAVCQPDSQPFQH